MAGEPQPVAGTDPVRTSFVTCRNSQGLEVRGAMVRFTEFAAVFEVYNPYSLVQLSEVLTDFRIMVQDRCVLAGRAVVQNLVNTGIVVLCEAAYQSSWVDGAWFDARLRTAEFSSAWGGIRDSNRALQPRFIQTIDRLSEWLDDLDTACGRMDAASRGADELPEWPNIQKKFADRLRDWLAEFEAVSLGIDSEARPIHVRMAREEVQSRLKASDFARRIIEKPLGFAGDFESVRMIAEPKLGGGTPFGRMLNQLLLGTPPAQAHRNRIHRLEQVLRSEAVRCASEDRPLRVLNMGSGPAIEVQNFVRTCPEADLAQVVLIDFSRDSLEYAAEGIQRANRDTGRRTAVEIRHQSIHQMLRSAGKGDRVVEAHTFDFVYCGGLFDYVSDRVCKRLSDYFFESLAPGGLLLVTNICHARPFRLAMEYLLDWHLIYRDAAHLNLLFPATRTRVDWRASSDETGVNLFLEVRRPS